MAQQFSFEDYTNEEKSQSKICGRKVFFELKSERNQGICQIKGKL